MRQITIIPDVHGRRFWRPAVEDIDTVPAVFLGDYLDPYPSEGITPGEAWPELQDIMALKRAHPDRVTLLLGNHDLHYVQQWIGAGRYDRKNAMRNREFFLDNLDAFDLTLTVEASGNTYLFSHAGIIPGWVRENDRLLFTTAFTDIGTRLNDLLHDGSLQRILLYALADTSYTRGGRNIYGSPVWADVTDYPLEGPSIEGVYQVFGHSWMEQEFITPYWACLDCGHAFKMDIDDKTFIKL